MNMTFRANGYESALMALQAGRPVVLQTAEGAHVVMASRHVSPDAINLMATHARGLVSMAISPERCSALGLSTQPRRGRDNALLYTQSIEAREGVATGISAADRALTVLAADQGGAGDIACPGHVFPYLPDGREDGLAARVLRLMAGAGLGDTAVTCLILDAEGETASPEAVAGLASALGFELLDAAVL